MEKITENRMRHMFSVAEKCYELALEETQNEEFARKMYLVGLIHDIGYAFDKTDHEEIGADIIGSITFNEMQFIEMAIMDHGKSKSELSKWERILKTADLTIDSKGNDVGFHKRLNDIKERYGEASNQYQDTKRQIKILEKGK